MELGRAYAILGVESGTPIDEVKQRYRMRAQMLHPDRQAGRPDLVAESQRAMAELNEAWEVVVAADQSGTRCQPGAAGEDFGAGRASERMPYEGECDLCGCRPATRLTLRKTTGVLIVRQDQRLRPDLCRNCGLSLFREFQASSLAGGWWGITAFFVNIANLVRNLGEIRRHQAQLSAPTYRDPAVLTPLPPGTPLARPVFSRPAPLLGSVAILALAVVFVVGAVNDPGTRTGSRGHVSRPAAQGICLDTTGYQVACGNPAAAWTITRQVASQYDCSTYETAFQAGDGRVFCAVTYP